MAEKSAQQGDLIPIATLAQLLEITPARVRQLASEGYIPIPVRGKTTIVGGVRGFIRFWKDEARKHTKSEAARDVTAARAEEINLRNAQLRRELIPKEDANLAMDLLVGAVAGVMDGLAARVTRDLPVRRKIEAEVHAAKITIAAALEGSRGLVATGRDPSETGPADDAR